MFGRFLILVVAAAFAVAIVARSSHGGGQAAVYVVKPSDTLWSIASTHYGGDPREGVWKVTRANHLAGGATLRPGQRLLLP